jgi:hypothetical protein
MSDLAAQLVAGSLGDRPMPEWFRARMLFQMWLPYQGGAFANSSAVSVQPWRCSL